MQRPEDEKKEEETTAGTGGGGVSADVGSLQAEISRLEEQSAENLAGWQRTKADFLNYKKDQERVIAELRKYANEDIVLALLPTVDSFELATRHLPDDLKDSDWVKGILCIKGMFENFLRDAGVTEIRALGEKFDPNLFEAVGEIEMEGDPDTVGEEVQKGYRMGDKVIRPAKVRVVR